MRHVQSLHAQIQYTEQTLSENQPAGQHDHALLASAPPLDPVRTNEPTDGPRERKVGRVVHANGNGDAARHIANPPRAPPLPVRADDGHDGEDGGRDARRGTHHIREAGACDEAGGEDPDKGRGHLEGGVRDGVDVGVEAVDAGGEDGADAAGDELAVELGLWRGAEQVARLEVLHQVAGLQGAGL